MLLVFRFSIIFATLLAAASVSAENGLGNGLEKVLADAQRSLGDKATLGVTVVDLDTSKVVSERNADTLFSPASVLKLLTTYVALKELGTNFAFETQFYGEKRPDSSGSVGRLFVVGGGDPSFVSEDALAIAEELRRIGVKSIDQIVTDSSLFVSPQARTGFNPYQAAQSALSFNQNCTSVRVSPGAKGPIVSLPEGSPIRLISKVQQSSGAGGDVEISEGEGVTQTLRISGTLGSSSPGSTSYWSVADPEANFAGVFAAMLERQGIKVRSGFERGRGPSTAILLAKRRSKDLSFILSDLNRYSSNFIANQIVFMLGCRDGSCNFARGIQRLQQAAASLGFPEAELADGSGLSRRNRVSPKLLSTVLVRGGAEFDISPSFIGSLSQAGRSGTLKKRPFQTEGVWAKTGTIDGVSSLAGYLQSASGRRYAFVIISNGAVPKSTAEAVENRIVSYLLQ